MINTPKMKDLYSQIYDKILYMIPEKWEKVYLYASVIENLNSIETGEMFFYYFPKGILKKNPVNVYEVPSKFNLDENEYLELAENLYDTIKDLRDEFRHYKQRMWSNITITIVDSKFDVEFNYENLLNSKYSNEDRHIIWNYKYLNEPIERLNKRDRKMLEEYLANENLISNDTYKYEKNIYDKKIHNVIDYNRDYSKDNDEEIKEEYNYEQQELERIMNKYETTSIKKKNKRKNEQEISTRKNQILNI